MQNWNDGKTQEYKNRTVYDILHSSAPGKRTQERTDGRKEQQGEAERETDGTYLFTTADCPNCRIAKEILQGEQYTAVDAESNLELVAKYGIMQAPTLVTVKNGQLKKYVNASNIRRYMDEKMVLQG